MSLKAFKDLKNVRGKTVLVRCDFDVPLKKTETRNQKSEIIDDTRLKAALPTIQYLLSKKFKVVLMGHMGRPKGGGLEKKYSLEPVAKYLEKRLRKKIALIPIERYVGKEAKKSVEEMKDGQVLMLENLRFSDREKKNCKVFGKALAQLGDIYINEAWGNSHREHSSMTVIKNYLPSYAGLNLEKEVKNLNEVLKKPKTPIVVIIGGAKIETKLPVISGYLGKAKQVLIGGVVANNFFKGLGFEIGKSLYGKEFVEDAIKIFERANGRVLLPVDVVTEKNIVRVDKVKPSEAILDIGPETVKMFGENIKKAKTIIWNGPMGKFENKKFKKGTEAITKAVLSNKGRVIIGGGDTNEILKGKKIPKNVFISTGGGAMLDFLAGKKLPGLGK